MSHRPNTPLQPRSGASVALFRPLAPRRSRLSVEPLA
jgi:hypothetical protein